jgi:outer membrane receptor protein involved in Fe transport
MVNSNKLFFLLKLFYAVLLFSLGTQMIFGMSGGKIIGKVTDKMTGDPIPGVNVMLDGTTMGAATDLNGEYFIINIPPGIYSIRASNIGYRTLVITGVEISTNHTTELDIQIEETVLEFQEAVTIIAERPLVEKDGTSTRHFVSTTEIALRPTSQLTTLLSTLPGINSDPSGQLTVRRGSLDEVSFLIDGMRASNPLDFQPYTGVNLSSIQELEIITGAFNAEYGQAQSGVLNIVTKDGGDKLTTYVEFRYIPPQQPHFGTEFYDYSTDRYWENTHARHLQWWIDNPDQWIDLQGIPGNDPSVSFTPEQAHQYYMDTHQPLTNYESASGYQTEIALGGPLPVENLFFFLSGRFKSIPPVTGNSYRDLGTWFDGTGKITYHLSPSMKFNLSGFYGLENSNIGMTYPDFDFISSYGVESKYAYHDLYGYPENKSSGLTLQFTHVLDPSTFYVLQFSRIYRLRSQSTFPGDEAGWELGVPITDNVRAVDQFGNPLAEAYGNLIGLHSSGYYYRGEDNNTDWTFSGDFTSQILPRWQMRGGVDFTYYILNRYQEAKAFLAIEDETYHPYEGAMYLQTKLEFEGLIVNAGLRYDFYNPNDKKYMDPFDPFGTIYAEENDTIPIASTEPTSTFSQFSPRIGIAHPVSENTVLHFSYGHFFQRAIFGDYGEGYYVSGILNTYNTTTASGNSSPYNLGNRDLKPRKSVEYEIGIEHNFGGLVADVTAYYKDISQTIRTVTVFTQDGGKYLTDGNGDYADSKGIEISINKPMSNYWSCYLNYTFTSGITGYSGDPDIIYPPESGIPARKPILVGDAIDYDRPKLKFGFTVITPESFSFLAGIFSNIQFTMDFRIDYPNENISSDVFPEGGKIYLREPDRVADMRIRKEFELGLFKPAIFLEIRNVFNDQWENVDIVQAASPEDRVKFINSRFATYPEKQLNGVPFPDISSYLNLPRQIILGISITY